MGWPVAQSDRAVTAVATALASAVAAALLWWRCRSGSGAAALEETNPWENESPDFPRGARWLCSLWTPDRSGTVPFVLRGLGTGLRPLPPERWIEVEPAPVFAEQVRLKRELLLGENGERFYASLGDNKVLAAEREVLEVLLLHLEEHHRKDFMVDRSAATVLVHVRKTGDLYRTSDYAKCPLKLCGLLVQEDFILLSPPSDGEPSRFVAGCACFSFMEVGLRGEKGNMELGKSVPFVHQNVPGFEENVGPKVAQFFSSLEPERPHFRTNWLLVGEEGLNPMTYNLNGQREDQALPVTIDQTAPKDLHLRVEFQCISRLPRMQFLLFSLHTYSNPLPSLASAPKAAAVLRRTILGLDDRALRYRGMPVEGGGAAGTPSATSRGGKTLGWKAEVVQYLGKLAGRYS